MANLNFLYKKLSMLPYTMVNKMIGMDEFAKRMSPYVDSDTEIDLKLIYDIVVDTRTAYKGSGGKREYIARHGESKWEERCILRSICKELRKELDNEQC